MDEAEKVERERISKLYFLQQKELKTPKTPFKKESTQTVDYLFKTPNLQFKKSISVANTNSSFLVNKRPGKFIINSSQESPAFSIMNLDTQTPKERIYFNQPTNLSQKKRIEVLINRREERKKQTRLGPKIRGTPLIERNFHIKRHRKKQIKPKASMRKTPFLM